jgi:hypothetical protein
MKKRIGSCWICGQRKAIPFVVLCRAISKRPFQLGEVAGLRGGGGNGAGGEGDAGGEGCGGEARRRRRRGRGRGAPPPASAAASPPPLPPASAPSPRQRLRLRESSQALFPLLGWIMISRPATQTSFIIISNKSRLPASGLGAKRQEQHALALAHLPSPQRRSLSLSLIHSLPLAPTSRSALLPRHRRLRRPRPLRRRLRCREPSHAVLTTWRDLQARHWTKGSVWPRTPYGSCRSIDSAAAAATAAERNSGRPGRAHYSCNAMGPAAAAAAASEVRWRQHNLQRGWQRESH